MRQAHNLARIDTFICEMLYTNESETENDGMTINEITDGINAIDNNGRCRMTIYRRLQILQQNGFVAKGLKDNHADTFYLLENGKKFIGRKA